MNDMDEGRGMLLSQWCGAIRIGALAAPLLACAALSLVREQTGSAIAVLALVLLVVAASCAGDRLAAVLAAVSGGVWFDFFLVAPYYRFTIYRQDDAEATVLLVIIGLAVAELALRGNRQAAAASRRSGYLEGTVGVARGIAQDAMPFATVTDVVGRQIAQTLGADSVRYVDGPVRDVRMAVLDHEGVLVRRGRPVDVDRIGLPTDEYIAVPVVQGTRCAGHFLLTAAAAVAHPSAEERKVAALLADQAAVALAAA